MNRFVDRLSYPSVSYPASVGADTRSSDADLMGMIARNPGGDIDALRTRSLRHRRTSNAGSDDQSTAADSAEAAATSAMPLAQDWAGEDYPADPDAFWRTSFQETERARMQLTDMLRGDHDAGQVAHDPNMLNYHLAHQYRQLVHIPELGLSMYCTNPDDMTHQQLNEVQANMNHARASRYIQDIIAEATADTARDNPHDTDTIDD